MESVKNEKQDTTTNNYYFLCKIKQKKIEFIGFNSEQLKIQ